MIRYVLLGALTLAPLTTRADDYSRVLTTTAAQVMPSLSPGLQRAFYRVCNVDPTNTAWLTRANRTPAPRAAGSFSLAPGKCEEFQRPAFIPSGEVWGVAESGTVQLTAEAY